eukprot:6160022-Pleurochrysis_carterae.AAC.1
MALAAQRLSRARHARSPTCAPKIEALEQRAWRRMRISCPKSLAKKDCRTRGRTRATEAAPARSTPRVGICEEKGLDEEHESCSKGKLRRVKANAFGHVQRFAWKRLARAQK